MAIKFVEALPASKRGGGARGSRIMTEDVVKELKANVGKWAIVQENVTGAQSVMNWVKRPENDGFEYAQRASGKKVTNQKGIEVNGFDVYVRFNPEGR